ncbi:MAG TPA: response regulator transcription factor [Geminicoccaceae bacterium]|nr:response regulator transcription factor [Geminicoccaceae bacterium]
MADRLRVLLADDHPLYRDGVARTLAERQGFQVVGTCGSAEDAVTLAERHRPDLVLLDISMPGGGIEAARRIAALGMATKIVMLTVSERDEDVMEALKAGAHGYALKGVGATELVDIVRTVASGGSFVTPSLAARLLQAMQNPDRRDRLTKDPLASLARREEQILKLVAKGLSNKEVARELDLQEKTVKHYMTSILQKLHVRNRVEAALLARDAGRGGRPGS